MRSNLSGLFLFLCVSPAGAQAPTLMISPSSPAPGAVVRLTLSAPASADTIVRISGLMSGEPLHFEQELGREPLADEPVAAFNAALAAFEELAEALAEVQRRADRMAAGFAESEIGQARRRAAEAAAQWEQAVTQFNARRKRRGA